MGKEIEMDKELIKALRCLAEGTENQGLYNERCAKKNFMNNSKRWKYIDCSNCPYFQTKYRIGGNVEGIESNVWISQVAEILEKHIAIE